QFDAAVNTGGNPRKLATIGRFAWVSVLCCCLTALVGVMTGSDSFALMDTDRERVFWFLVAAGGLAAGVGMLLHSHGSWKARLGLFFVASFAGAAAAVGPAAAWRWRTAPLPVLALGFALWGGVLGSWYGQLRGHPRLGGLLGFLLLGGVAGMALVLDHPDLATGFGLVVGL